MKKTIRTKILAWVLCIGIVTQSMPVYAENVDVSSVTSPDLTTVAGTQEETGESAVLLEEEEPTATTGDNGTSATNGTDGTNVTSGTSVTNETADVQASAVYEDGNIKISNIRQLEAVGSGAVLTDKDDNAASFGTGTSVSVEGTLVTYSLDGQYTLMNDISLDAQDIWCLPEGFSGNFSGESVNETAPLYDRATDTIYIYNNYQLLTIASDNSENEPVMSNDMIASEFGIGQFLYADGTQAEDGSAAEGSYLTYSKEHNYVLSKNFTEQMPELTVAALSDDTMWLEGEQADGRTVPGQLYTEIDGEKYILIGNESQLRAVGSNKHVTPRLYICYQPGLVSGVVADRYYIPYYLGDADLGLEAVASEGGTTHLNILLQRVPDEVKGDAYTYYESEGADTDLRYVLADVELTDDSILSTLLGVVGSLLGGLLTGEMVFCGVDATGRPNNDEASLTTLRAQYGDLYYSSDANYIIFRDIDLSKNGENSNKVDDKEDPWSPINLSGNMEGRKGMVDGAAVTISNINVLQEGELDPSTTRGLGFFGSISSQSSETDLGFSAGTTLVEDIHLDTVSIINNSTVAKEADKSLVEALLELVGGLLGGVLGITENIVQGLLGWIIDDDLKLNLSDVIQGLLTKQQLREDTFATGSFAGRVIGDVKIQSCSVTGASVTSEKGMSGGFVGYTEGQAKYDLVSQLGENVVKLLANLLNLVPGLGLGDLITVLLENDIALGQLLPIGYYNPQIINCSVSLSNGSIGKENTDYNGGFVGIQNATKMTDCTVSGLTAVNAATGAGGFAGLERDAVVDSLLTDIGLDLYTFDIQSTQTKCKVESPEGTAITVTATGDYAGGFNGVMTNSVSRNCTVGSLASVSGGKYVGGFSGRATIGYGTVLGGEDEKNDTLLGSVTKLLTKLVAPENEDKLNTLLTLSGLTPSEIYGCTVTGSNLTVTATGDYAGGLIGQGDGVMIASVSAEDSGVTGNNNTGNSISGITSVTAENYAGGIAGSVVTANPIGVLNTTLGVGSYLPFTASDITLTGQDLTVTATWKYASGGFGLALGGTIKNVSVNGLAEVEAANYAGGLAGRSGTGALVREGGLDLLGLGLVKVDNLLSLVEGVQVKISDTSVTGIDSGAVIEATGQTESTDGEDILAGGFVSEADGIQVTNSHVSHIKQVTAEEAAGKVSYAGGFAGRSHTGGLAGIAQEEEDGSLKLPGIVDVSSLLNLVPYLIPKYTNCTVSFMTNGEQPQVEAWYAGGFFGAMQSGQVDDSALATESTEAYAVSGLEYVKGGAYAGGFAGRADAGALASSDGLELLGGTISLNLSELLNALSVYIPEITTAGVRSTDTGLVVEATGSDSSAGGYMGYGSGVQIKDSDVTSLRHTQVNPPSDSLESTNGESYFDNNSSYAVKAGRYAGGYIGCADIDSAAGVGGGLGLLGGAITLDDVLGALDVVATKIEGSNVSGCVGGYSVLANGADSDSNIRGMAGGYVGRNSGTRIENSDALNFAYIIGRENAGGYAGLLEPGNVASVLEDGNILDGLLDVNSLLSVMQSFIPIVEDCQTTCIPCGGAVRADGYTDDKSVRGMAGGYVGYNHGGRITGETRECAVVRLRSVYGGEFAGGFCGLMENAAVADTGNLELLFGLLTVDNVLGLLQAVYPTDTGTAVYGPLRNVDMQTWNNWATAVGANGVYGYQFPSEPVSSEGELQNLISSYAYGYNVRAGRSEAGTQTYQAGTAGGYVGRISGGVVTEAHAWDGKDITAYESAGGFAGEMFTEGAAEIGNVNLAGLPVTGSISALQTFVPVIRNSDVTGYQSGMTVKAFGTPDGADGKLEKVGYAGGFVGHMVGGQIWGNWGDTEDGAETGATTYAVTDAILDSTNDRCFVDNLRSVSGTNTVGGFAGKVDPGSAAALDTASSGGLLGGLLQGLIDTPGDLLSVLEATVSTICAADVKAWDAYGITINGAYSDGSANTAYAKAAGGFAGEINGAVIGERDAPDSGVTAEDIRSVTGGEHAGGFFGLADVSAVAEITGDGETSILGKLLELGSADVLDAFRSYIYSSSVSGTAQSGLAVYAHTWKSSGLATELVYTGNAGGFGGTLLNGTVKDSKVVNLRVVEGLNYTGGFIGHLGKSGTVDLDSLGVLDDILGVSAGVLDVFGSHVEDSAVSGLEAGFTVKSKNSAEDKAETAGGFAGYADLAKLEGNTVSNLKQVASGEIAGGFAGRTSFAYLADISADSALVNQLVYLLDRLLQELWLKELQEGNIIKINLGIITVDALYDGNLVHVNLLGLDISIALAKEDQLATIYIGDSKIEVNCAEDGSIKDKEAIANEIQVSLIKANRTAIRDCTVTGISDGYDVYGGGAGNSRNGSDANGYAGGFVGFNDEGLLQRNQMYFADVVRGTNGITGPFTGSSSLESSWNFNTLFGIEGEGNKYRIYRDADATFNQLLGIGGKVLQEAFEMGSGPAGESQTEAGQAEESQTEEGQTGDGQTWNIYTIAHMKRGGVEKFTDLENAVMSSGTTTKALAAYQEDGSMAVLMDNTPTAETEPGDEGVPPDVQDPCEDTVQLRLRKVWEKDSEEDRPEEIILYLTRSYETVDGTIVEDMDFTQEITLSKADQQSEDIWETLLSGQPYTAYHVGEDGSKYHYTYFISEKALDGYETTVSYADEYHYTIEVTNRKQWFDSLLPDAGGMGTALIYTVGILLLCFVAATEYRKRRKQSKQNNYKKINKRKRRKRHEKTQKHDGSLAGTGHDIRYVRDRVSSRRNRRPDGKRKFRKHFGGTDAQRV